MSTQTMGYTAALLAAMVISLSYLVARAALRRISLPDFLLWRAAAALVFTLPLLGGVRWPEEALAPADWLWLGGSLLLSPFLVSVLYFAGLQQGNLATQNALRQTSPAFLLVLATLLPRSLGPVAAAIPAHAWWGGGIMVMACLVLALQGESPITRSSLILGLSAGMMHAFALLAQSEVLQVFDRITLMAAQNGAFLIAAFLMRMATARWHAPEAQPPSKPPRRAWPWKAISWAVLSALLVQICFDWLKFSALQWAGPLATSALILFQLPLTVALAWGFYHEKPGRWEWTALAGIGGGALLILAGGGVG